MAAVVGGVGGGGGGGGCSQITASVQVPGETSSGMNNGII